jgi:hypothetical protein
MAETIQTAAPHRIASEDESIILQATHTPGYTHLLEVEERWPEDMDRDDVWKKLATEVAAAEEVKREATGRYVDFDESGARQWFSFVTPHNSLDRLERIKNFRGILDGLGYEINVETRQEGDETVSQKTCRYPSVDRINSFMADVFGDDQVLKFVAYDGGDYGVTEFMEPFAEDGEVLIGAEQPFEVHDLSDHALGWIGLSRGVAEGLRRATHLYLRRNDAERQLIEELPPHTWGGEHPAKDEKVRNLFNPSMLILTQMLRAFDLQTDRLAEVAFYKERHDTAFDSAAGRSRRDISGTLGHLFSIDSPEHLTSFPGGLIGGSLVDMEKEAAIIYERYRRADEAGREMAAS